MPKTKLSVIKPFLAITDLPDGDVLHRLISVHDGMLNNPAYTTPPVDMAGFKAVIDAGHRGFESHFMIMMPSVWRDIDGQKFSRRLTHWFR